MIKEDCSLIGYVLKPHGKSGQVVIRLNGDFADEIEPGEPLFLEIDETMVPFFVEELEGFSDQAFVKLEFLDSAEEIRRYAGCKVYLKTSKKLQRSLSAAKITSEFIGYNISDVNSGLSGTITGITNTPSNPLFEIDDRGKHFYIPIQNDLIVSIDKTKKFIKVKLPEGFADI